MHAYERGRLDLPFVGHCTFGKRVPCLDWNTLDTNVAVRTLLPRPELVDMAKVPDDGPAKFPTYDRHPVPLGFGPASGVLARAERATAEQGQWLMDDHVELMTEAVCKEFQL